MRGSTLNLPSAKNRNVLVMPNIRSAKKRLRQNDKIRLRNRTRLIATRNQIKKLEKMTKKQEAEKTLQVIYSQIDSLAKLDIIHRNKAANQKARLAKFVNSLS